MKDPAEPADKPTNKKYDLGAGSDGEALADRFSADRKTRNNSRKDQADDPGPGKFKF